MACARRVFAPATLVAAALLAAGCGAGSLHPGSTSSTPSHQASPRRSPAQPPAGETTPSPIPQPTRKAASPAAVKVIEAWASALRRGELRTAALYFRIPSVFDDGPGALLTIHNLAQAEVANEALPCGAKFISADQRGRYVNALFRLTGRSGPGGGNCGSGAGETARTDFVIQNGRISEWLRAPDDPGDNGSPGPSPSPSPSPSPGPAPSPGATPLV
jgi:hypothetical protein